MAIHTEFSLTPLCGPQLPSVCLCVSIFPFWALVLHRALEMLLLARDGVLKCPAAAVTMTTWEKEKKKTKPNLVQNASLVFLTCPANLIISSMKAAPATSQHCYFCCLLEKASSECTGESPTGQQIIWSLVFRQTG